MAERAVVPVKDFKLPAKSGKYYRLICMTGQNKGMVYYLHAPRIVMGRGENVDIQIHDTKSSREHAELTKVGDHYVVTDLGSHNGIVVNDLKVTQHQLANNDRLIIGQTVYKYGQVTVKPESSEVVERDEDDEDTKKEVTTGGGKKIIRMVIIGGVLLVGLLFMLDDGSQKPKATAKKTERVIDTDDSFSQHLRQQEQIKDRELEEKLGAIIHRGRRELREGNYYRALNEFNMALILSPKHGQASFYLQKAKQMLDEEIEAHFLKASKEVSALKYSQAIVSYCSVIRILGKNINDARYQDALNRITELEEKMGMVKGEVKCIEE